MDLVEVGLSVVDWIGLAQDRYRWRALVNSVMNLGVPENAGKLSSGCATCGLSICTELHRRKTDPSLFPLFPLPLQPASQNQTIWSHIKSSSLIQF
jgi:hypothetical protein